MGEIEMDKKVFKDWVFLVLGISLLFLFVRLGLNIVKQ